MRYGAKILFEDVSTAFTPGKRYGLTGPNGSGKSTFMKVLTGELEPQKGNVVRPQASRRAEPGPVRFRCLPRYRHRDHGQPPAMDRAGRAREDLREDGHDRRRRHASGRTRRRGRRRRRLSAESDAAICSRSGYPDDAARAQDGELQGGQKVRVLLAQALFGSPQALLLDEPTNHLDLDSIHWLQDF